jgi:integrase
VRLTEKYLQTVKATGRRDLSVSGRRGLILRIALNRGNTARTFRYRFFRNGAAKYATLGEYPALTLADAHELHARCVTAAKTGADPQAVVAAYWAQRAPRPVAASGPTVADVVKEFLVVAQRQRRRPEQARYLLEANVLPSLGQLPAASIRKRDLVELFDKIVRRGSPVLANRVQAVLQQAFRVAADRDLIEVVPIFPRALAGGSESVRTRVLSEGEVKVLWHGLNQLSQGDEPKVLRPLAIALQLQLVTAQRRGEIAAARWDQVTDGVWRIPTSPKRKSQANVVRYVPLSPLALQLLKELRTLANGSDYWLPNERTQKVAVDRARSISKAAREIRTELKMADWRPHDLRRTARTFMAKIGITQEVAERVLGHGHEDPMVATYNQYPYAVEMKEALEKWATELKRITSAKGAKP